MRILAFLWAFFPALVHAGLVEDQLRVPVRVTDMYGRAHSHEIVVTFFHEDTAPRPMPVAILNHGRSSAASERAAFGRVRYASASRWLAGMGFMVVVPTRIGYGVTGGEDPEWGGAECHARTFAPGFAAAADQVRAALDAVRAREGVAKDRAVVIGQSFGGVTAIALAARGLPGVQAAISFAGGAGGDPKLRPGDPCSAERLGRLFAEYGKAARIPTLWIYAENDRWFAPLVAKDWFAAFRGAGGNGELVLYPPHGVDGHALFNTGAATWQPRVLEFLRANGYENIQPRGDR